MSNYNELINYSELAHVSTAMTSAFRLLCGRGIGRGHILLSSYPPQSSGESGTVPHGNRFHCVPLMLLWESPASHKLPYIPNPPPPSACRGHGTHPPPPPHLGLKFPLLQNALASTWVTWRVCALCLLTAGEGADPDCTNIKRITERHHSKWLTSPRHRLLVKARDKR